MKNYYLIYLSLALSLCNLQLDATKKRHTPRKKIYSQKLYRDKKHKSHQRQKSSLPNKTLGYIEEHVIGQLRKDLDTPELPYGWELTELEKLQNYVTRLVDDALDRVIGDITPAKVFIAMNGIWCACICKEWLPFIGHQGHNGTNL